MTTKKYIYTARSDNTYDYGDTSAISISRIIKGGVVITADFRSYAPGSLRIIILRDGEH